MPLGRQTLPDSRALLLEVAAQFDDMCEGLRLYGLALEETNPTDPNRGRIDEARDFLEAAAGRLRCAILMPTEGPRS